MRGGQQNPATLVRKGENSEDGQAQPPQGSAAGSCRAGLLAAVGLLVVVLYAQPAEANFPGKPGKIAFAGQDAPNGDYEIYTINASGGGRNHTTDNSTNDRY